MYIPGTESKPAAVVTKMQCNSCCGTFAAGIIKPEHSHYPHILLHLQSVFFSIHTVFFSKAIVDSNIAPSPVLPQWVILSMCHNSSGIKSTLSASESLSIFWLANYGETWRDPQNQKYTKYITVPPKQDLSHGHNQRAVNNFMKFGHLVFEIYSQKDTEIHKDTLWT